MRILAADTSTPINTVALCDGSQLLAETVVRCGRAHSERLLDTVSWVLEETGLRLPELDILAISNGPGSFTGLRVGIATWKGLAQGAELPLIGVPTLDAMARLGAFQDGLVCPMLDAKMDEVFGAVYSFTEGQRTKWAAERVGTVEELLTGLVVEVCFLGDGAERYRDRIEQAAPTATFADSLLSVPRASTVAAEALTLLEQGVNTDPARVTPFYLRKSQAERNRTQQKTQEQKQP